MVKDKEIKMRQVKTEMVSPKRFLDIPRNEVRSVKFVPPKLGSATFGKFKVEYKYTKFRPVG